jgi:plasmid stability protein
MAALSIRDLDDDVTERLRVRAAGNGRSMESEVRGSVLATRNVKDFEGTGVTVTDPWTN